ncbi:M35 family metallo-endopeptidase [Luteibacter sp.]|jgi:hypothetical protein|uniref:M35 family metallo-endopeptidase n=1 Tax=Luteibacter sp. TaxID=1886636 RepID=UPI002F3FCB4A
MNIGTRLAALTVLSLGGPAADAENAARLHVAHDGVNPSAPNTVMVSLSNPSDHDVFVYTYQTAFAKPDGRMTGSWFDVEDAFGNDVRYKGRFVVSGAPTPSAYTRIRPGSSVTTMIDLSKEYELPDAGEVLLSTQVAVYEKTPPILASGEVENIPYELITSNSISFFVAPPTNQTTEASSVITCTPKQEDDTRRAITAAQSATEEATRFLSSLYYGEPATPENLFPPFHMTPHRRYQNWFGVWDDAAPQYPPESVTTDNYRVDLTVNAAYIRLFLGRAHTVCDQCSGYDPTTRAWAEGTLIHLCPVNFTDPITGGITSQAGTIVHEGSHQNDEIARGTVDLPGVTNRASAHALPRSAAVTSAANYEYFITNTPLGREEQSNQTASGP